MTTRHVIVPFALAALFGCGGDLDSSTGDPAAPIEGEEEIAAAWCETLVRCDLYPDVESCVAAIDVVGGDVRAAWEAGHVAYDASGAAECEAALADVSCEELTGAPDLSACDVWDGTVPDGGDCVAGAECVNGTCDAGDCDPALSCCTGTCAAQELYDGVPEGGDCSIEACVAEAYCDVEAVPATCRALVAVDQPCMEGTCEVGLYCRLTDSVAGTGVCSGLPGEGEPCDPAYPLCARADNWCDAGTSTCRKLAAVGEDCDEVVDNCVPYAWCSPEGRCQALPGEGEPCADWPPCLGDLECTGDTCEVPPADEACEEE